MSDDVLSSSPTPKELRTIGSCPGKLPRAVSSEGKKIGRAGATATAARLAAQIAPLVRIPGQGGIDDPKQICALLEGMVRIVGLTLEVRIDLTSLETTFSVLRHAVASLMGLEPATPP